MVERVTIAGLQGEIAALRVQLGEADERIGNLTADLASANERADRARDLAELEGKRADQFKAEAEAQQAEVKRLGGSLKAYKGSATRARNEALVLKAAKSPEARPIGALPAPRDNRARVERKVKLEDAFRDGPTTIVFSDGKREIRELEPLVVDANAWWRRSHGEVLNYEPLLEPGDMPKPSVTIAGFGLLNEDGEQVSWLQLPDPIVVPRGGSVRIPRGSIFFA